MLTKIKLQITSGVPQGSVVGGNPSLPTSTTSRIISCPIVLPTQTVSKQLVPTDALRNSRWGQLSFINLTSKRQHTFVGKGT